MSGLDYGVIGNGASAALINKEGRIDWCCLPAFDSSSVFAALLDEERGGYFGLALDDQVEARQEYVERTNILRTVLRGESGTVEILDCMPRDRTPGEMHHCPPEILRYVRVLVGRPRLRVAYDPRYVCTVNRTYEELCENGLMYRYRNEDDFGKPKTSFTVCSFWMVTSLFRTGRQDEARAMFDDLLAHANHLGLFSEDMDFKTKRLLGNFPQGYSHLALIDAAITLAGESDA